MQLTDQMIGTINDDGSYNFPYLLVNGQPFNRGGGYSTRRLDDTHFVCYTGVCPEIEWKSKTKKVTKESKHEQNKRETPAESVDE